MTLHNVAPEKPPAPYELPNKRVVLQHRDGMFSIAGEFKADKHELKPLIEIHARGQKRPFGLIKVTPRSYIYREIVEPVTANAKAFDPRQV